MNKKLLIIIIAVVVAIILFLVALFIFPGNMLESLDKSNFEEEVILYSYDINSSFITNIKDSSRFIKTSIVMEVDSEEEVLYLEENEYIILDKIIEILRNKTEEEFLSENIQDKLKTNIKEELESVLEIDNINSVYFKEFVIQ